MFSGIILNNSITNNRLLRWLSGKKNLPAKQKTWVWSLGLEDLLEKTMVTHFSILVWEILWTEEPSGLQSMGSQRVRHNLASEQQQQHHKWVSCTSVSWGHWRIPPIRQDSKKQTTTAKTFVIMLVIFKFFRFAPFLFYFYLILTFYCILEYSWLTVCDSFRCTAKGLSHPYTRTHSFPNPPCMQAVGTIFWPGSYLPVKPQLYLCATNSFWFFCLF